MHFFASRKLNNDTSATNSELPVSFPSLLSGTKNNVGRCLNLTSNCTDNSERN